MNTSHEFMSFMKPGADRKLTSSTERFSQHDIKAIDGDEAGTYHQHARND